MNKLAVLRIRGDLNVKKDIKDTLKMLRLYNKNYCVVLDNNSNYIGMINKIKDYVTWGELDKGTFELLLKERGRLAGNKKLSEDYLTKLKTSFADFTKDFFESKKYLRDIPGLKQFFRLSPPIKGFERGGIKKPFSLGGALGYRKDNINDLVKRMI
ncbi:MAG: 50S ribosomal protein L30 [Nanoarchaeota archaeon]